MTDSEHLNLQARRIPVTCNKDCGGGCPLLAHVEGGRLTRITDNPLRGPYMVGCARGYQMPRVVYSPERLTRPLLRNGPRGSGQFRAVDWSQALDYVADRLADIKARYGPQAIMRLGGSGSCRGALHNSQVLTQRFLSLLGGYTDTTGNYSSAAVSFTTPYVLGTNLAGVDPATLAYSNVLILWGANVADNRLGCELEARVREAKARGVPVIVLDPRRSRTARTLGTQWIPVRPGTDSALMMAVLYVLLDEGLVDRAFIERYSVGFDALERTVRGQDGGPAHTPVWAEVLCGTPADVIVAFARQYGQAKPAALIPGLSIQRTMGGEEASRLAIALQVATGNLGRLGGTSGGLTWKRLPIPRMPAIGARGAVAPVCVHVYRWPDAILGGSAEGYPSDVRAVYNVGGNWLVQGSDVHKSIRAFQKLEFAVCHDYFLTPTARHCDVVLPVTTFLERQDVIFPEANYLLFSSRAVPPQGEARNDYDVFCELAERLGFGPQFSEGRDEEAWLRHLVAQSEVPDYEEFKRTGIYMGPEQCRVGLADFVADPDAHPLRTPSGRVEIASPRFAQVGFPEVPEARILGTEVDYPLRMVTPKARYRTHSQYDNIAWFKQREPQQLWMHPQDAAARGIADGQLVLVYNAQGRVRIAARVTPDIMPGVVCLLAGVWPRFEPDGTDTAGSPNVLTCTEPTLPSQGSRTHSVLVQVKVA